MSQRNLCRKSASGFSLLELMIVAAIILLLAALATPQYLKVQQQAYEASAVSFLRTLQSQQESYRLANGFYADNFNDLGLYAGGPAMRGAPFATEGLNAVALQIPATRGSAAPLAMLLEPALVLFPVPDAQQQPPQKTPPGKESGFGTDEASQKKKREGEVGGPGGSQPGQGAGKSGRRARKRPGTSEPGGEPGAGGGGAGGTGAGGTGLGTGGATGSGGTGPAGQPGGQGGAGGSGGSAPTLGSGARTNLLVKQNYVFRLRRPTPTSWWCAVEPVRDRTDSRFFFVDQTGTIHSEMGKPARQNSPVM